MGKGRYGVCPSCLQYKYLNGSTCKTCSYSTGECVNCQKNAKIYVDGLCYICYQNKQVGLKIEKMESQFVPFNDYNKQLFELYLSYIKRYHLHYYHVRITAELITLLQREKIHIIKNWHDIYILSDCHLIMQKPHKLQGCAFIKIGLMLSELGVLPPREKDVVHDIEYRILEFRTPHINEYVRDLRKINTAEKTIIDILRHLKTLDGFIYNGFQLNSIYVTDKFHLLNFFDSQLELIESNHNKRKLYLTIKKFYSWAVLNKHININPMPQLKIGREAEKLVVCSAEQFLQLKKYVTSSNSDPDGALLLALTLFFGFSTEELTYAQLIKQNDRLFIKLRRQKLTKGKKYYNRKELLPLPTEPKWFLELQQRFYQQWIIHYQKVKKTFPNTPLILPKSNISNRFLNTDTVRERVLMATKEATGIKIPIRVLRQTCGHLYASKADASILATLGWSDQYAFQYTWLPRTYIPEN